MIIVICDDEKYWCEQLERTCKEYFEKMDEVCEIYSFPSGEEFLDNGIIPDMLFQDIELGDGMNGVEVVKEIQRRGNGKTFVAYVTFYDHYMREAFDVNVVGFLEKPVTIPALDGVMKKIMKRRLELTIVHKIENRLICVRDIQCIKAQGAYSIIYLDDGTEILERALLLQWEQ